MDLLKELHNLYEAEIPGTGLVEIKDVVESFPTKARKAILALLSKHRLAINGVPILDNSDNDVISMIDEQLRDEKFPIQLSFDAAYGRTHHINMEYEDDEYKIGDSQLEYLGYEPERRHLLAGYTTFLDENIFNEEWDKAFEEETNEEFDYENHDHKEAYNHVWEQFKDYRGFIIVTLDVSEHGVSVVDHEIGEGRLYSDGYNLMKHQGIVDVILD